MVFTLNSISIWTCFPVCSPGVLLTEDNITSVPVIEGQPVTLHTDLTKIRETDMIWWKFAESKECSCAKFVLIATLSKTNNEVNLYNETIQQFKGSLELNHNTGSLTITSITPEHYGYYKLHITSKEETVIHTFSVVAHVSRSSLLKQYLSYKKGNTVLCIFFWIVKFFCLCHHVIMYCEWLLIAVMGGLI